MGVVLISEFDLDFIVHHPFKDMVYRLEKYIQEVYMYKIMNVCNTICEVILLGKKKQEKDNQQKNHNEFNSITQKVEPENQNQTHNARKEGIQPVNQKR